MSYAEIVEHIGNLAHYREYVCTQCGQRQQVYTLTVHSHCERCSTPVKLRCYAATLEIEDVIDAVLGWLGEGMEFEQAMERKRLIDSEDD
jgi:hypothetical protein